jgi:hypothetical protein
MPEYLSPGVYIEETSYRAKSIQGVATSTAGFVGACRFGPVQGPPPLVTSFEEFRRMFGGLEDLVVGGTRQVNYLAHAVKAFFDNGGQRVYVARIFGLTGVSDTYDAHSGRSIAYVRTPDDPVTGADETVPFSVTGETNIEPRFRARFPGITGNLRVRVRGVRSGNLLTGTHPNRAVMGVDTGDVVQVVTGTTVKNRDVNPPGSSDAAQELTLASLHRVQLDELGRAKLFNNAGTEFIFAGGTDYVVQKVTLLVDVGVGGERVDGYSNITTHPASPRYIGRVLRRDNPEDSTARVWFGMKSDILALADNDFAALMIALVRGTPATAGTAAVPGIVELTGGDDGAAINEVQYRGGGTDKTLTGLAALNEVDDVAIVAAPGGSFVSQAIRNELITHCENNKFRFAILSGPLAQDEAAVRNLRAQHDSTYAALYYPWVMVPDPRSQTGEELALPPDGFIAGIYARSDIERGVHKAPANEVVRGALRFSRLVNKGHQDTLNPEGINCLRFFEGRGYRVWGARTISSDTEWMYVNVRRLFIFLEHSIEKNTKWAVFEPNNEALWLKMRLTIESFLNEVWRTGALMGTRPQEAFFVRCDRSTMTQSDLDNGRLVVLIGVAPTKPAEFVVFRIGQWTADASVV